jgi:ATP-dependent exoDNAse (exonuclease V) beta subunit
LTGYLSYITDAKIAEAEGSDEQTVNVITYHAAKGLEWPVVILFNLEYDRRGSAFDLYAKTEGEFDPQYPLNNRILHFWPNPICGNLKSDELNGLLLNCTEQQEAIDRDVKERQRLLYVGFTRARDILILAVHRKKGALDTKWLDELTDAVKKPLIILPIGNTDAKQVQEHTLNIGGVKIPITVREFTENQATAPMANPVENKLRPMVPTKLPGYSPSRYSPSTLEPESIGLSKIQVSTVCSLGERIPVKGHPDYNYLGDAVHNFLALDQGKRNSIEWRALAQRLLTRYKVTDVIEADNMVVIHDRLTRFIKTNYPEAKVYREWPISLREPNNQLMHGWIDMLLETKNGFVIIDHKTFPGANAEERAQLYAPQLNAYCRAVKAATGKTVFAALIHMPIIGKIFDVG